VRDEVLRGQEVAGALGLAALAAVGACAASSAPRPATVEIVTPSPAAVLVEPAPRPSARAPAAAPIQWVTSEREARERARRNALPLLVWVRAEWAAAALQMERKTWVDPRVARAAAAFVALRLDVTDAEGDAELLAQRYAVDTTPATIVFDAAGRKVAVLRGFTDVEALVAALTHAAE